VEAPHVLILGDHNRTELADMLSSLGFSPSLWSSTINCLAHLRDRPTDAVVVDRDFVHADVLQFLLFVKEIDDSVPVLIVGRFRDEQVDQAIMRETRAVFVDAAKDRLGLRETLATALKSAIVNE
jgi:DNA-binding NtrC family response regulator